MLTCVANPLWAGVMKQAGFTLVELMITLMVLAIAVAIAVPSFEGTIQRNSVISNTNQVVGALNFARVEATKRGSSVYLASSNTSTAGNTWGKGYVAYVDTDSDGNYDSGEELRVYNSMPNGITLTSAATQVKFNATGFASAAVTLQLCSEDTDISGQGIGVSASGREIGRAHV